MPGRETGWQDGVIILSGRVREGLIEKMTCEVRPGGDKEVSPVDIWGKGIQGHREQQVQRPDAESVLEEQGGGRCGWSTVSSLR